MESNIEPNIEKKIESNIDNFFFTTTITKIATTILMGFDTIEINLVFFLP